MSEQLFADFNPLDPASLDGEALTFNFRDDIYWLVTNSISKVLFDLEGIRTRFADVKALDEDGLKQAVESARVVCSMASNRAFYLLRDLKSERAHDSDPRWLTHWKLDMLSKCLKQFYEREFDDASFAFYISTMTRKDTLAEGYRVCEEKARAVRKAFNDRAEKALAGAGVGD